MSDSVADNPFLRNFRNFSTIAAIAALLLAICYYISGILLLFSTSKDLTTIDSFFSKDVVNQFIAIHKNMIYYWKFYIEKWQWIYFKIMVSNFSSLFIIFSDCMDFSRTNHGLATF